MHVGKKGRALFCGSRLDCFAFLFVLEKQRLLKKPSQLTAICKHTPEYLTTLQSIGQKMQWCLMHPARRCSQDRIRVQERENYVSHKYIHLDLGELLIQLWILATSNGTESVCQSVCCCWPRLTASSQHESVYTEITGPCRGWEEPLLPGDKLPQIIKDSSIRDPPNIMIWVKQQLGPESPLSCPSHTLPGPEPFLTITIAFYL